eukprot:3418359-Pyramimonas_sp.AAC.1
MHAQVHDSERCLQLKRDLNQLPCDSRLCANPMQRQIVDNDGGNDRAVQTMHRIERPNSRRRGEPSAQLPRATMQVGLDNKIAQHGAARYFILVARAGAQ